MADPTESHRLAHLRLPPALRESFGRAISPLLGLVSATSSREDGQPWRVAFSVPRDFVDRALKSPEFARSIRLWRATWGVPDDAGKAGVRHITRLAARTTCKAIARELRAPLARAYARRGIAIDSVALEHFVTEALQDSLLHAAELRGIAHEFGLSGDLERWLRYYAYTGLDDATLVPRDFLDGGGVTLSLDGQGRRIASFKIPIDAPGGMDFVVGRIRQEMSFLRKTPERGGGHRVHTDQAIDEALLEYDEQQRRAARSMSAKQWDRAARAYYMNRTGTSITQSTFTARVRIARSERHLKLTTRAPKRAH